MRRMNAMRRMKEASTAAGLRGAETALEGLPSVEGDDAIVTAVREEAGVDAEVADSTAAAFAASAARCLRFALARRSSSTSRNWTAMSGCDVWYAVYAARPVTPSASV